MTANMSNYDQTIESFELAVPTAFNFARDVIDTKDDPQAPAIRWVKGDKDTVVSYRELSDTSKRVATALQALGVRKGVLGRARQQQ